MKLSSAGTITGLVLQNFENWCSKPQSLKSWTQAITIGLSEDTPLLFPPQSRELLAGSLYSLITCFATLGESSISEGDTWTGSGQNILQQELIIR
jgi:hypothetical protein